MSNNYTKLFSVFDKARDSVISTITKYVKKHSNCIDIPYNKLYSTSLVINKEFLPIKINVFDGQCFIDYYNIEEVYEFGFETADIYSDALYNFTMDELYYIIQCIYYSETKDMVNMQHQCN